MPERSAPIGPEQGAVAPPLPDPFGATASAGSLAMVVLLWLLAAVNVAVCLCGVGVLTRAGGVGSQASGLGFFDHVVGTSRLVGVAVLLCFVWWLGVRYAAMRRLRLAGQELSPATAVVAVLLPVSNAIALFRALAELWRSGQLPVDYRDLRSWRRAPLPAQVPAAAALMLLAGALAALSWYRSMTIRWELEASQLEAETLLYLILSAAVLGAGAAIVAARLVLAIDLRQAARREEIERRDAARTSAGPRFSYAASVPLDSSHVWQALGIASVLNVVLLAAAWSLGLPAWTLLVSGQLSFAGAALFICRQEGVKLRRLVAVRPPSPAAIVAAPLVAWGSLTIVVGGLLPMLERTSAESLRETQKLLESIPPGVAAVLLPLLTLVAAPLIEEALFRGVLFGALSAALAPTAVIALTAVLFGLVHMNLGQIVTATLLGLHCGYFRWRTGSIWPGVLLHLTNNAIAAFLLPALRTHAVSQVVGAWISMPGLLLVAVGYGVLTLSERGPWLLARGRDLAAATLTTAQRIEKELPELQARAAAVPLQRLLGLRWFHGAAVAVAALLCAGYALETWRNLMQTGAVLLLITAFYGFFAWNMARGRRVLSCAQLVVYASFAVRGYAELLFLGLFLAGVTAVMCGERFDWREVAGWFDARRGAAAGPSVELPAAMPPSEPPPAVESTSLPSTTSGSSDSTTRSRRAMAAANRSEAPVE